MSHPCAAQWKEQQGIQLQIVLFKMKSGQYKPLIAILVEFKSRRKEAHTVNLRTTVNLCFSIPRVYVITVH